MKTIFIRQIIDIIIREVIDTHMMFDCLIFLIDTHYNKIHTKLNLFTFFKFGVILL